MSILQTIGVGDQVLVTKLGQYGEVLRVNKSNEEFEISVEGRRAETFQFNQISLTTKAAPAAAIPPTTPPAPRALVDVHGRKVTDVEILPDRDFVNATLEDGSRVSTRLAQAAVVTVGSSSENKTVLDWALWAATRGWHVVRVNRDKTPATPHGHLDATLDPEIIRNWWPKDPNEYNYLISLGPSNLVAYDWDSIVPDPTKPATFRVKTGRNPKEGTDGGYHDYYVGSCKTHSMFATPVEPITEKDVTDKRGKTQKARYDALNRVVGKNGVTVGEIRSRGAYVIGPGSVHLSGRRYEIVQDFPLAESPAQDAEVVREDVLPADATKLNSIATVVETAIDAANLDRRLRAAHEGGFKILIDCPWEYEHTGGKHAADGSSSSAVLVMPSGALVYSCRHAHCEGRGWSDLRAWLEETMGHKIAFSPATIGKKPSPTLTSSVGLEVREPTPEQEEPEAKFRLPHSVMTSSVFGDLYDQVFEPNGWPLELALPALATAGSVIVPRAQHPEGQIIVGNDSVVSLYTAMIGKLHCGKSQVTEWATKSIGIYANVRGPHYTKVKNGSAEQMWKMLSRHSSTLFHGAVLIDPDEWSYLLSKANIPESSFASTLTTAFYNHMHSMTLGGAGGGKEVDIPFAISFVGGVVDEQFESCYNSATTGGLYDRTLFGLAPNNFMWSYRAFPYHHPVFRGKGQLELNPVPVAIDPSVWEVVASWNKKNEALGRIIEICSRIATIFASVDGRPKLTGVDLEKLWPLAEWQLAIRDRYRPNPGINQDAIYSNVALGWISANAQQWRTTRDLKVYTNYHRRQLGPTVCFRALQALARDNEIDIWMSDCDIEGKLNPMPVDYTGKRPKLGSGLVRAAHGE